MTGAVLHSCHSKSVIKVEPTVCGLLRLPFLGDAVWQQCVLLLRDTHCLGVHTSSPIRLLKVICLFAGWAYRAPRACCKGFVYTCVSIPLAEMSRSAHSALGEPVSRVAAPGHVPSSVRQWCRSSTSCLVADAHPSCSRCWAHCGSHLHVSGWCYSGPFLLVPPQSPLW